METEEKLEQARQFLLAQGYQEDPDGHWYKAKKVTKNGKIVETATNEV